MGTFLVGLFSITDPKNDATLLKGTAESSGHKYRRVTVHRRNESRIELPCASRANDATGRVNLDQFHNIRKLRLCWSRDSLTVATL